jgi:hypothetical protein
MPTFDLGGERAGIVGCAVGASFAVLVAEQLFASGCDAVLLTDPPQSKFPDLSGHASVPMDDEHTLCLMFSYHPTEPLPARTRALFLKGHNGRESGHASRNAYAPQSLATPMRIFGPSTIRRQAFCLTMKVRRRRGFPACLVFS